MIELNILMDYLAEREGAHRERAAELAGDSRGDEANFEKIRANVFGIFKAVLETAMNKYGDGGAAQAFFAAKLIGIPSGWREALAAAVDKGDSEGAYIERLKLQSVAEIEKMTREGTV